MKTLITNIKQLVAVREQTTVLWGEALAYLPCIADAWLLVEDGRIAGYGEMSSLKLKPSDVTEQVDAGGGLVLPCWCDSHTHLVFAATREDEFVKKIAGATYVEIAAAGGGILASARKLNGATKDELYHSAAARLKEVIRMGTGAIEIKSGYGLSVEGELKMLRVIKRLKSDFNLPIKATLLAAHALPETYKENKEGYLKLIIDEMLPVVKAEGLADYIDVFCEEGFFTADDVRTLCRAAKDYGLKPKLHVAQLTSIGGIAAAVEASALTVDHLETMMEDDVKILSQSATIGTLLPTAAFFLRMGYPPARQLINAGCALALASDFNPGSSPSGNMNFVVALACIQMRLQPEEAVNAATINGAFAMEVDGEVGSISIGKKANVFITKPLPSYHSLPYFFGHNLVQRVMLNGVVQE